MFKEKDNMRPGPTPERVLAICRLVAERDYSLSEIFELSELDINSSQTDEAIRRSVEAAEELRLIKKNGIKYILEIDKFYLESAQNFRKIVVRRAFENSNSTFFKMTEWFIKNGEVVRSINRFDDMAAMAAKTGVDTITENDVLGWRFWMRYLGHAYQYNKTLIPNMKVRLQDAIQEIPSGTRMTCTKFVAWIKENIPEAAASCNSTMLPLAISNGLRSLQSENLIDLVRIKDAVKLNLYPLNGVELNEFSEIIIKGGVADEMA